MGHDAWLAFSPSAHHVLCFLRRPSLQIAPSRQPSNCANYPARLSRCPLHDVLLIVIYSFHFWHSSSALASFYVILPKLLQLLACRFCCIYLCFLQLERNPNGVLSQGLCISIVISYYSFCVFLIYFYKNFYFCLLICLLQETMFNVKKESSTRRNTLVRLLAPYLVLVQSLEPSMLSTSQLFSFADSPFLAQITSCPSSWAD